MLAGLISVPIKLRLADHPRAELDSPVFVVWSITRRSDARLLETSRTVWLSSLVRFHYSSDFSKS